MEIDTPARRVLATRLKALSVNDMAMVRECEWQLARWGVSIDEVSRAVEMPEVAITEKRVIKTSVKTLSKASTK